MLCLDHQQKEEMKTSLVASMSFFPGFHSPLKSFWGYFWQHRVFPHGAARSSGLYPFCRSLLYYNMHPFTCDGDWIPPRQLRVVLPGPQNLRWWFLSKMMWIILYWDSLLPTQPVHLLSVIHTDWQQLSRVSSRRCFQKTISSTHTNMHTCMNSLCLIHTTEHLIQLMTWTVVLQK